MTEEQKKKYEQQAASIFPMEMIGGGITKTDRQLQQNAFIKGAEHAHSEGFDACLKMIEEERNLLENTGSLMWHKPDEQNKTLHIAECLSVTLKYINKLKKLRK